MSALASVAVVAMAAMARRSVPEWDDNTFRKINGLPDALHGPVWPVMQLGSLASVGVVAGLTRLPQISLPLAQLDGCPLGFSLLGGPDSDEKLLELAEALEAPETP